MVEARSVNLNTHTHTQQERVDAVAADPDNLESRMEYLVEWNCKEAGREAQDTLALSKIINSTNIESVSPWSRLVRGFSDEYD